MCGKRKREKRNSPEEKRETEEGGRDGGTKKLPQASFMLTGNSCSEFIPSFYSPCMSLSSKICLTLEAKWVKVVSTVLSEWEAERKEREKGKRKSAYEKVEVSRAEKEGGGGRELFCPQFSSSLLPN